MKTGIELIAEERQEQVEKHGWTKEHDAGHKDGTLAKVAAVLCCLNTSCSVEDNARPLGIVEDWGLTQKLNGDRIHQLKVAGALCAAEIDRLQA